MAARITGNITEHSRAIAWYSRSPQQMDAITIEVTLKMWKTGVKSF
jgi:hypothetical protein